MSLENVLNKIKDQENLDQVESLNESNMDFSEMSKEELVKLKIDLMSQLSQVKGLLKETGYEGYVSMRTFADMCGLKLSSMRSRYEIYCVRHEIEWTKFDGDKGHYFKVEDAEKVAEAITAKRKK